MEVLCVVQRETLILPNINQTISDWKLLTTAVAHRHNEKTQKWQSYAELIEAGVFSLPKYVHRLRYKQTRRGGRPRITWLGNNIKEY